LLGHAVVHHQQVERPRREQPLRLPRPRRRHHLVALVAERAPQRLQDLLLVVDEEDGAAGFHHAAGAGPAAGAGSGRGSGAAGSSMRMRVPSPGRLCAEMAPPIASTMFFAMARPRPLPVRLVVKYGSKTCDRSARSMPTPWSSTSSTTRPGWAALTRTSMSAAALSPPRARRARVASRALAMMFTSA